MRVMGVHDPGQAKVSYLQQQLVCVDEDVGGLQVPVQNVRRVDELQSPEQLVEQQRGVTWSTEAEKAFSTLWPMRRPIRQDHIGTARLDLKLRGIIFLF